MRMPAVLRCHFGIFRLHAVVMRVGLQGSANSSVERSRERLEKHEREKQERPGRRKR